MYQNFIGIDIGKADFFVSVYGSKDVQDFENNAVGFRKFFKQYKAELQKGLVVLETTGGYEIALITFLQKKNCLVHRANTRKVKHFIRSYGQLGKSDKIDAMGLARYAYERHPSLIIYTENSGKKLLKLVNRRNVLKHMITQEKNRAQAPDQKYLGNTYKTVINALNKEIKKIETSIDALCDADQLLTQKKEVLISVSGVGDVIAVGLLAMLPELGFLDRRKIASLAGLAPHPFESGSHIGHRFVRGGRDCIKPMLFMAAMAASRSKSPLGDFYRRLVASGKKKMVALTALMRKIIVIANARLRDFYAENLPVKT